MLNSSTYDVYRITNASLAGAGTETHSIEKTSFVIDLTDQTFHHFLVDQVGQFIYLSTIFDLNLIILHTKNKKYPSYISWTIDKLSKQFDTTDIVLDDIRYLRISEIVVMSTRLIPFYELIGADLFDRMEDPAYHDLITPPLRDFLISNLSIGTSRENIYISRRAKSRDVFAQQKYLNALKESGVTWSMESGAINDPNNAIDKIPANSRIKGISPWMLEIDTAGRYLSPEDESRIEKIFTDNNYKIVNHTQISFDKQLELCANATAIAAFNGASAFFTIVAPEDAKIIILNPDTKWPFYIHHYIPTIISDRVYHSLDPEKFKNTRSIDLMISEIEKAIND